MRIRPADMPRVISFVAVALLCCLVGCGKQKAETPTAPAQPAAPVAVRPPAPVDPSRSPDAPPPPPPPGAPASPDQPNAATPAPDSAPQPVGEVTFPVSPEIRAALAKFFADNQRPATGWQDLI